MTSILEHFEDKRADNEPTSLQEVFGLALARALRDVAHWDLYCRLSHLHSDVVLADAARRHSLHSGGSGSTFDSFSTELERGVFDGDGRARQIVALKIERRSIAVAVFYGARFGHTNVRSIGADGERGERTVVAFVQRLLEDHPDATIALEHYPLDRATQRVRLVDVARQVVRASSASCWEADVGEILGIYTTSEFCTREQVRRSATSLWPMLSVDKRHQSEIDAALLGYAIYCKGLFQNVSEGPEGKP